MLTTPTQPEVNAAAGPTPATDYDSTENMFRFFLDQFSGDKSATIAEEIINRWYYEVPLETNKK